MKMSPVSPFDSSNKNKSGMLARVLPYWIALPIWFNCQNSNNYINLISRRKLIWFSRFLTSLPSVTPVVTSQPIYSPNSQHSWTDYSLIVLRNDQLQTNKQKGTFQPPSPSNPARRLVGCDSYRYTFCILHLVCSFAYLIFWHWHAMSND